MSEEFYDDTKPGAKRRVPVTIGTVHEMKEFLFDRVTNEDIDRKLSEVWTLILVENGFPEKPMQVAVQENDLQKLPGDKEIQALPHTIRLGPRALLAYNQLEKMLGLQSV